MPKFKFMVHWSTRKKKMCDRQIVCVVCVQLPKTCANKARSIIKQCKSMWSDAAVTHKDLHSNYCSSWLWLWTTSSGHHSDSAARPNNVNITSCSVWRQQPSVRFCTLRTSLWTSPVPWPWALLDNTALDNGAWILRKSLSASFSRYYQRRAGKTTTNKTCDENLLWFEFFYILL